MPKLLNMNFLTWKKTRPFITSVFIGVTIAFMEMKTNKFRSLLSLTGVLLGTASLVAMVSLIGGVDIYIRNELGKWAGTIKIFATMMPQNANKLSWSRSPSLKYSDGVFLENTSNGGRQFHRSISRYSFVSINGLGLQEQVIGVDATALTEELKDCSIVAGASISDWHINQAERVCIVPKEMCDILMSRNQIDKTDQKEYIGKLLLFQGTTFRIIGMFAPRDAEYAKWELRESIFIPITAMKKYIVGRDPFPSTISITINPEKMTEDAMEIREQLKSKHRGVVDFEYAISDWVSEIKGMLVNISIFIGIISAVSLFVGGLSIMNIMLSGISERVKEIGIRKALGASKISVFVQFLTEAVTLSFAGGIVGILLGVTPVFFKDAIRASTQGVVQPSFQLAHICFTLIILSGVGILSGLYPAIKASKMTPVEALRYE